MLQQLVHPFWRHDQAPLPILEVLLAFVPHLTRLIDHTLDLVRMKRVKHLKKEVAFRELVVPVWQIVTDVIPVPDLTVDVLHRQPRPVRHSLRRHLLLSKTFLLAVEYGL